MSKDELEKAVHVSLNQMKENGYWDTGADPMQGWANEDIARDLIAFDCDCNDLEPADLLAHVQSWRDANGANHE